MLSSEIVSILKRIFNKFLKTSEMKNMFKHKHEEKNASGIYSELLKHSVSVWFKCDYENMLSIFIYL